MKADIDNLREELQHSIVNALRSLVDEMFDRLDDELLGHAESAISDHHKYLFVDAIRELRKHRSNIISLFLNGVSEAAAVFPKANPGSVLNRGSEDILGKESVASLSLLLNVELEENLAVDAVVSKAREQLHNKLEVFNDLLASLTGRKDFTEEDNPFAPEILTTAFRHALALWGGEMLVRRVVYDAFGDVVILQLDEPYQQLIDRLLAAGVEPLARERKTGSAVEHAGHRVSAPGIDVSPESFEGGIQFDQVADALLENASIFNLVSMIRSVMKKRRIALGLPDIPAGYEQNWPVMGPAELMEVIQQVERGQEMASPFNLEAALEGNESFKQVFHKNLDQLAQRKQKQVNVVDQHVIDVLILLFDFVLEDPLMPAPMKVLLSRLQIPMLRIALQDKKFLTEKNHPARQLLNNLSWAAIRWVDNGDYSASSTYGLIEQAINRVLQESYQDASLYTEISRDFLEEVKRQESAAKLSEERLKQLARGQEQLAEARSRVDDVLNGLVNEQIPVAVYRLLDEPWRDVLTLIYLREGENSDSWVSAISLVNRLLDSVIPREKEWERQKLMRDIPPLIADLREGFASISYDAAKSSHMLQQLQLCHIVVLRGLQPAEKFHPSELADTSSMMPDTELLPDQYDELAQTVREGQWIAWQPDGSELRAKLAWRSEIADLMLFVDSRGRKVVEMTSDDLAGLFRASNARVLYDINLPIVERGLSVIYKALRSLAPDGSVTMRA